MISRLYTLPHPPPSPSPLHFCLHFGPLLLTGKGTSVQKMYTDMKWALLKLKILHNPFSSEIDVQVNFYFCVKIHVEPHRTVYLFSALLLYGPWKIIGLTRTNMVDAIIEFLMGFLQPVYYILLLYYLCIFRGKQWKRKKVSAFTIIIIIIVTLSLLSASYHNNNNTFFPFLSFFRLLQSVYHIHQCNEVRK